jgi:hypothetical protein
VDNTKLKQSYLRAVTQVEVAEEAVVEVINNPELNFPMFIMLS